MGYMTRYNLEVRDTKTDELLSVAELVERKVFDAFNDTCYFDTLDYFKELVEYETDEIKWYDHEKDMRGIAKKFPTLHFRLEGRGEDRDDWWIMDFLGDKWCKSTAKLIPPDSPQADFEGDEEFL